MSRNYLISQVLPKNKIAELAQSTGLVALSYGKTFFQSCEDFPEAFQYEVFKMLKKEGKINDAIIENMLSWNHSGFHVMMESLATAPSDPSDGLVMAMMGTFDA